MSPRHRLSFILALSLTFTLTLSLHAAEAEAPSKKPEAKPAPEEAPARRAPVEKFDLQDGDSIVFLGDSITHQCLYTQYVEDYFYTRYPHMRLKFHNAGVGGAKAWDALERFGRDVARYQPKYVTILLGMNDGRYRPYDHPVFLTYQIDMTELLRRITEIGATPILMTPTMHDSRAARMRNRKRAPGTLELYNSVLAYYGAWLREVAVESGYGFVDMYGPLNSITLEQRKTNPDFTLIRDAIHPGPPGQLVMAFAILNDMNAKRRVSTIRINIRENGTVNSKATGGTLSGLKTIDDGLEFVWLAESLPWTVPEEAQAGAKLLKLGHKMSREALEIHGLAPGRYEVSIDGEVVGTHNSAALERHIELQSNTKTPQYQQSLAVAALNKQRNDGPIHGIRGEWRNYQSYSRLRASFSASPENVELAQKVIESALTIQGQAERVAQHEQAAKELEDKIFETNQPLPRRYVLKRIAE